MQMLDVPRISKGRLVLKRKMLGYLRQWRREKRNECLLLKGARQVGKSFIVGEFGRSDYRSYIPIDFIEQPQLRAVFQGTAEPAEIYQQLSLVLPGVEFIDGETLIFLDEIQECPEARTALKYLAIDGRFDVIASGSLLGIQFREGEDQPSIPVGYEREVEMHPLDFEEFLWARGYDESATAALGRYAVDLQPVPQPVHEKMMRYLREYLAIGGMPAVVQRFIDTENYGEVHAEQTKLLASYLDDIAKYASATERVKARACYLSLPRQLAKENTKFQYAVVEKRSSSRKFEGSIDWLVGARMVLKCPMVSMPSFPLAAYEVDDRFRIYANDTGLLMAMYGFEMMAAVVNDELVGPMKGGLYENLVGGTLVKNGVPLRYWMSRSGDREIEFLVDGSASVIPVEVKASRGATISLNEFLERDDVKVGYKLIDGNVGKVGKKVTLPLYLAMFLFRTQVRGGGGR